MLRCSGANLHAGQKVSCCFAGVQPGTHLFHLTSPHFCIENWKVGPYSATQFCSRESLETFILSSANHLLFRWRETLTQLFFVWKSLCTSDHLPYPWISPSSTPSKPSQQFLCGSSLYSGNYILHWAVDTAKSYPGCDQEKERERKGAAFQSIRQEKIHPPPPVHAQVPKTPSALLSPSCSTDLVLVRKIRRFDGWQLCYGINLELFSPFASSE